MKNPKCSIGGCHCEGKYSIYELREGEDLVKVWWTGLCDQCERGIDTRNQELRKSHKIGEFKEVYDA